MLYSEPSLVVNAAAGATWDLVPFHSPPGPAALRTQLTLLLQRKQGQQIGAPVALSFLENIRFHYHYYF